MTRFPGMVAELTTSLTSLWTRYAGTPPTNARTEIRGNVVTCVLTDGVGAFNERMIAPRARERRARQPPRPPTSVRPSRRWSG